MRAGATGSRGRWIIRLRATAALLVWLALPATAAGEPATERVTVSSAGEQGNAIGEWWYLAPNVAFSETGDLVAFSSDATNLVRRDRNRASDVFVRDRVRGVTERVSLTAAGREADDLSFGPAMSADGRFVAFLSQAANLPSVAAKRPGRYVFVRDRQAATTTRVDVSTAGTPGRGSAWAPPVISADGRYVAFTTDAPNLTAGDADTNADAFVRDRLTGETVGLSIAPGGNADYEYSVAAAMSRDGRFVVVVSESPLAPGGSDETANVFLFDRLLGTTRWVGQSGADIFDAQRAAVSDDGRLVAFEERGTNFGVVLWDAATATAACISCWDGVPPATWDALSGMSADGRRIAYVRQEKRRRGTARAMFMRDRAAGTTARISVGPADRWANGDTWLGGMSPDGRFAAFASDGSNLVTGDTNRRTDMFVRGPL